MPSLFSAQPESSSIEGYLSGSTNMIGLLEENTCDLKAPYVYRMSSLFNGYEQEQQPPKLMPADKFNIIFNVVSRSINSNHVRSIETLLHHRNEVGCRIFFQEEKGKDFLRLNLSHEDFPNEWLEQIIQSIMSQVKQMFEFDESFAVLDGDDENSSDPDQSRVFRLQLEILLV
ncbi:uncharacterized protein LOC130726093 [Lotus japonicus]|uniref:uncharacterized protein LOC130726093 n=1 Tax=Lotus japonicus TaxID=34305 RepID=UPI002588A5FA|nr:uncharacterized protein LOC130726093 [Lotus japonicus]